MLKNRFEEAGKNQCFAGKGVVMRKDGLQACAKSGYITTIFTVPISNKRVSTIPERCENGS